MKEDTTAAPSASSDERPPVNRGAAHDDIFFSLAFAALFVWKASESLASGAWGGVVLCSLGFAVMAFFVAARVNHLRQGGQRP
jgi:hypothetical protein